MGTQITANRAGTCPLCNKAWKQRESFYWDKSVKNTAGFSVSCIDQTCFEKQGGTITPKSSGFGNQGYKPYTPHSYQSKYERDDVTATLPDGYESNVDIDKAANTVLRVITKADKVVNDMYPNLKHDTNTYGQIRSKLTDQILSVLNHSED